MTGSPQPPGILAGKWVSEKVPAGASPSSVIFGYDGRMVYIEEAADTKQVAKMTYTYDGAALRTVQLSTGEEAVSKVHFISAVRMVVTFADLETTYCKVAGPGVDD